MDGDSIQVFSFGNSIRGLVINPFSRAGILTSGGQNNIAEYNYIGTDLTGTCPTIIRIRITLPMSVARYG